MSRPEHDDEFANFVRDRSQALARSAYLLTGNAATAEDLLQTALMKVLRRWPSLQDRSKADAYVRRVMVTTFASWWRRKWRGERPSAPLPELGISDATAAVDERQLLFAALGHLPPRQRAAVVLRHYNDLSEADTALALGCSLGTVKSQTARGLDKLRDLLVESQRPLMSTPLHAAIEKERAP